MTKFYLIPLVILLCGCSKDIDFESMEKNTADEIFAMGKKEMTAKNYSDAAKIFEELEKLHPYSRLIADAELLAGDCYYKKGKFDEAISSYEIFVKTHPTHKKVPYAIYMLGVINYEQMAIIERDQEATVTAKSYLEELCARYPESEYVKDAQKKIKDLQDQQAGREVYIARYYQDKLNYAAAIGRLNTVIDNYPRTIHAPEAMLRLVECYLAMGLDNEAQSVNKILQKEHFNSKFAEHARNLLSPKIAFPKGQKVKGSNGKKK